jgi:hypothetical protein
MSQHAVAGAHTLPQTLLQGKRKRRYTNAKWEKEKTQMQKI